MTNLINEFPITLLARKPFGCFIIVSISYVTLQGQFASEFLAALLALELLGSMGKGSVMFQNVHALELSIAMLTRKLVGHVGELHVGLERVQVTALLFALLASEARLSRRSDVNATNVVL